MPSYVICFCSTSSYEKIGATKEQLALVSLRITHGLNTPYAHFYEMYETKGKVTLETILNSPIVSWPLSLFDCCPQTDGAVAVIIASMEKAKKLIEDPVYMVGTGQGCTAGTWALQFGDDPTDWKLLKKVAKHAYEMVGIKLDDVDVAEVHDCFTISELIAYEEFGWCEKGKGGKFIEDGQADYGGKVVVNPRGGLIACGHPFGATGSAQAHEMFLRLRGVAGARQAKDAKIGLTHNLAGPADEHVIIWKSYEVMWKK